VAVRLPGWLYTKRKVILLSQSLVLSLELCSKWAFCYNRQPKMAFITPGLVVYSFAYTCSHKPKEVDICSVTEHTP
jgi:hypothetical protein